MATAQIHFFSKAIQKECEFNVCLPDRQDRRGPDPVFYLLHGLSDDSTAWLRWTSIERYVRSRRLIVVMPDTGRGWYTDATDGLAYETYLVRDLIGFVDRYFPTVAKRAGRAIGGLSMGGYGAIKLALKHPNLFCSANSHSGALALCRPQLWEDPPPELKRVFGTPRARRENDPFLLAKKLSPRRLPAMRIDCGVGDFLIEHNRQFHRHLERLGVPHEYEEFEGEHEWGYWDVHVQEALEFHCRNLGIR